MSAQLKRERRDVSQSNNLKGWKVRKPIGCEPEELESNLMLSYDHDQQTSRRGLKRWPDS